MDWWKLFALLVTVASLFTTAEGVTKKKIRIHLPQKVKHIHHHKKIYITNHPASSQYAPAYLPTAEGAMAVPTSVALPSRIVPLKPVELYDDRAQGPLPHVAPSASKLLPLYRARGYYGPQPSSGSEEQEFDLVSPSEPTGPGFAPSAFSEPSAPAAPVSYTPKKVKVIKVKEAPRKKKVLRRRKPKRVVHDPLPVEEEHPVTSYHEKFYSDIDGTATIKKIKKPKRVEKILDGDTEHIHTYTEEHIHKVVFNDPASAGGMSALAGAHPLVPVKGHHPILTAGSLGTPSHLEYAGYNPRDVTHDHIFHDHGEIPPHLDVSKDGLGIPPKASYTSSGVRLNSNDYRRPATKIKHYHKPPKPFRPVPNIDFSYYESIYNGAGNRPKPQRHVPKYSNSDYSTESNADDFRPVPSFKFKENPKSKYYGQGSSRPYYLGLPSNPVPFSTSIGNGQEYNQEYNQENNFGGPGSLTAEFSFKEPFPSYRNQQNTNFAYDTYGSASNTNVNSGNRDLSGWPHSDNRGKKSISTQNINFGGQDHKTIVDHLAESSNIQNQFSDGPAQVSHFEGFEVSKPAESVTPPTQYTITENSPQHEYYTNMALQAFEDQQLSMPEASNDNYHYAEAPSNAETTPATPLLPTTAESARPFFRSQSAETTTELPTSSDTQKKKTKLKKTRRQRQRQSRLSSGEPKPRYVENTHDEESQIMDQQAGRSMRPYPTTVNRPRTRQATHIDLQSDNASSTRGKFKYGDKL